jgi:hypothetical protein
MDFESMFYIVSILLIKCGTILGSIETGPDEGSMTLVDINRVKKILGI